MQINNEKAGGGSAGLPGLIEDEIVRALRQIMRAVDMQSKRLAEDYGLTGPQLLTLRELERRGRLAASSLARAVHLSNPTMTGILKRLENRGLVSRSRGVSDRRTLKVEISAAGRAMLERAPSLLQDSFRRELGLLEAWETTQILATLQRVASLMNADQLPAAPHLVTGAIGPADAIEDDGIAVLPSPVSADRHDRGTP